MCEILESCISNKRFMPTSGRVKELHVSGEASDIEIHRCLMSVSHRSFIS